MELKQGHKIVSRKCSWTAVDATFCHPCCGSVGSLSCGPWLFGRTPSDSSIQEGISIPTFWSASALRATNPMHPCDFWVIPSIMAVAMDVSFCHHLEAICPTGPKGGFADSQGRPQSHPSQGDRQRRAGDDLGPTMLIWRILQRHVHTSLSCRSAKAAVSSGWTVLNQ